ncbi:MAG: amidase [Leucobacter sp.]|nr:amidase [Leucobacter sp.]
MLPIPDIDWPEVARPERLEDIIRWSAAELSAAIRSRAVTCVEVMTAYLDRIELVNPRVNAITRLRPRDELLAEAAEKDRLLRAGSVQGWMHGFPHAVKDLADVADWQTSYGFFHPGETPPAVADAIFVERIRAAGAIFIGRTNTPEFGLGSHTYNRVFGTTGNAYDPARSAGGSSGGAAVAVALHLLPVADGSDFMGSLRNPPGWNNVYGLRPSTGRVPGTGEQFVHLGGVEGPIARTVQDLALLLSTMAGYDDRAPLSVREDPLSLASVAPRAPGETRIAWLGDLGGYLPMEPEVLAVTEAAVARFEAAGAEVRSIADLPAHGAFGGARDLWPLWLAYRHAATAANLGDLLAHPEFGPRLKPEAVFEIEGALGSAGSAQGVPPMPVQQFSRASAVRSDLYEAFRGLFDEVDVVLLPTAQIFPFDAALHWPTSVAGRAMDTYHRWMEVTTLGTLLGAPTAALPAGFSATGLPIGVQAIGRNHGEHELLAFAAAWEAVQPFGATLPPEA